MAENTRCDSVTVEPATSGPSLRDCTVMTSTLETAQRYAESFH